MVSTDEKKLVLARLATMPLDMELSLGNAGSFDKEKLIKEVNAGSDMGDLVVEVYMNYLRSFSKRVP
ncbi:MAG: hypothetical protein AABX38_02095 [Candidatus Micrarchaeota archaeon]